MRAKLQVSSVIPLVSGDTKTGEVLRFHAVAKSVPYPADGSDEDNSFARWSPSASFELHCANPALFGKFQPGEKYYVDFTPADVPPQAPTSGS